MRFPFFLRNLSSESLRLSVPSQYISRYAQDIMKHLHVTDAVKLCAFLAMLSGAMEYNEPQDPSKTSLATHSSLQYVHNTRMKIFIPDILTTESSTGRLLL